MGDTSVTKGEIMNINGQKGIITATVTAGLGLMFASGAVGAVTSARAFNQNATGFCQSALPVFDGQIRKRPLAIQNEGTASAFVSCSFMSPDHNVGVKEILLYADNNTGSAVDISCTLVSGISHFNVPTYHPQTITMPANSGLNLLAWTQADNGGVKFNDYALSVSCNLPVGTGLSFSSIFFDVDVGA
jgi:hypothetical protein